MCAADIMYPLPLGVEKLRPREGVGSAQGCVGDQLQSWDSSLGLPGARASALLTEAQSRPFETSHPDARLKDSHHQLPPSHDAV